MMLTRRLTALSRIHGCAEVVCCRSCPGRDHHGDGADSKLRPRHNRPFRHIESSAPPEHAKIEPVNNLRILRTVRNWGTLPDGRRWGSVSAVHVDIDGKHIWAGIVRRQLCAGSNVDPMVKLDPNGKVVQSFGAGQILWPHGMDVDRQGNVWVVDARSATRAELAKFPDAKGKGHTVLKFSPQGKLLMTWAPAVRPAIRRRSSPSRTMR